MTSAGKKVIESNGVKDPADQISRELAAALASSRGAKVASSPAAKVASEEPKAIAAAHSGSDYVIDVRTINWSSVYFPTNWARYRVIYSARLRLIETKTGRVVAEGFHARIPEQTDNAPTQDELLANNAAVLKRELQISAAESVAHFKKNVLGL